METVRYIVNDTTVETEKVAASIIRSYQLYNPCVVWLWLYKDAPQAFKDLSVYDGGESWIVFIPAKLKSEPLGILEIGMTIDTYVFEDGSRVKIGKY